MKRRILFIANAYIGDTICVLGLLSYLCAHMKQARVTVIVASPAVGELFEGIEHIEEVIYCKRGSLASYWGRALFYCWARRWEVMISIRSSPLNILLLPRIKHRLYFGPRAKKSELMKLDYMATAINRVDSIPLPKISIPSHHFVTARKILPEKNVALALSPFSTTPHREWPIDYFAELADRLTRGGGPMAGAPVVLLGAPHQRRSVLYIEKILGASRCINLMGAGVNILAIAALIERARLFITNDSGLMHLASAATTKPFLSIFSWDSADRWCWASHNNPIRPSKTAEEWRAWIDHPVLLPVDDVYEKADQMLNLAKESPSAKKPEKHSLHSELR